MDPSKLIRSAGRWLGAGIGLGAATYGAYVAVTWLRYGHEDRTGNDPLLDQFMQEYDVVERHRVVVAAPADITFSAACDQDIQKLWIVRAVLKGRALVLGSKPEEEAPAGGIVAMTKAIGWGVLAEAPGREIVMGAVTRPWEADVVFHALPPNDFAAFHEPGYVKIVWTLRADPIDATRSEFQTETRASTTDAAARAKFRKYWSVFSPGIALIRRASLGPLKAQAERAAREANSAATTAAQRRQLLAQVTGGRKTTEAGL